LFICILRLLGIAKFWELKLYFENQETCQVVREMPPSCEWVPPKDGSWRINQPHKWLQVLSRTENPHVGFDTLTKAELLSQRS
jgi:hypothetical protein